MDILIDNLVMLTNNLKALEVVGVIVIFTMIINITITLYKYAVIPAFVFGVLFPKYATMLLIYMAIVRHRK
jgi:hypothetical protein